MTDAELLTEYALGELEPEARRAVERRLEMDARLRAELAAIQGSLDQVWGAADNGDAFDPRTCDDGARRLEQSMEGVGAFLPFLDELMQLFDLEEAAMLEALGRVDSRERWQPTAVPGVSFVHFVPGSRLAGAEAGLVRFAPGASFPEHRHHGREATYVLQGSIMMSDGTTLLPGDLKVLHGGCHAVWAGASGALYATFHDGMTVPTEPGRAG
ncbi:MAG: cupin domain-containing protein [Myxococcota bacterium]